MNKKKQQKIPEKQLGVSDPNNNNSNSSNSSNNSNSRNSVSVRGSFADGSLNISNNNNPIGPGQWNLVWNLLKFFF